MSIVESIGDLYVRKILNSDPNFERLRYLAVLTAATEPPFVTSGTILNGKPTFNVKQLWRIANHLGLDFERFRGAERVLEHLERAGLVSSVKNEETQHHTMYYLTELGLSQSRLNMDRLRKLQEFESQAKTMQMAIKKQLTSGAPKAILEISLAAKIFTIGRDDDNDLSVEDPYISGKHARITYTSDGWVFEDLNSRNGSYKLETGALSRISRSEVTDNGLYQLGSTIFRFRCPKALP
jgi:hypothetical protein